MLWDSLCKRILSISPFFFPNSYEFYAKCLRSLDKNALKQSLHCKLKHA